MYLDQWWHHSMMEQVGHNIGYGRNNEEQGIS